jgi:hypothetical protein
MPRPHRHPDAIVADLAERQHGRVARRQLLRAGLTRGWVDRRVHSGHLLVEHHGVYAVGHRSDVPAAHLMSGVLAGGEDARLSHLATLMAFRVLPYAAGPIHLCIPRGTSRSRAGLRIHHAVLAPAEMTRVHGIPCTSVDRALLDSALLLGRRRLERACDEAAYLRLLAPSRTRAYLETRAGHRGVQLLRSVLDTHDIGSTRTASELEERFLALCDAAGFPRPVVNRVRTTRGGAPRVDFIWAAFRLVVETDGRAAHDILTVERRDAVRDRDLGIEGFRVRRFTWWDVVHDGARVTAALRPLLGC